MPVLSRSRRKELKPHNELLYAHVKTGGAVEVAKASSDLWHDREWQLKKTFADPVAKIQVSFSASGRVNHCGFEPTFMVIKAVDSSGVVVEERKCDCDGPHAVADWLTENFGFAGVCVEG